MKVTNIRLLCKKQQNFFKIIKIKDFIIQKPHFILYEYF